MKILALDPGPKTTGLVVLDGPRIVTAPDDVPNETVLCFLGADAVICEKIGGQGGRVGTETFETVRWYGRFEQGCAERGIPFHGIRRSAVTNHLYPSCPKPWPATADARVRKALLTRYTKDELKHVKGHAMAALAVGIAWLEMNTVRTVTAKEHSETPDRKLKPGWDNRA